MAINNNYYVATPSSSDYEQANTDVIVRANKFSKRTHRLLTAIGDEANVTDGSSTNFKYLEDRLFSTKDIKMLSTSDISMLDENYINECRKLGCTYKVFRFNRKFNIRSFDFILTYKQLSAYGARIYKPVEITKQFKGSLLFSGCSIIRDVDTMEEIPLKLYGKYESIGDNCSDSEDVDFSNNAKGGPSIKFRYTYDDEYVYFYIISISPYRLIPTGNGEYKDISYAENKGLLADESKVNVNVISDPFKKKYRSTINEGDSRVWCEVSLSLKDTSMSHTLNNPKFVDYTECEDLNASSYENRAKEITLVPTNDGEQVVIGMAPSSQVNMELAPDIKPLRFGTNLLQSNMDKVKGYISNLKKYIINLSSTVEKVPFTIKTSIKSRGKYNIKSDFFIDSDADKLGEVLVSDVGYYDSKLNKFFVKEFIFDKKQTVSSPINTVRNYKNYKIDASSYLKTLTEDNESFEYYRESNDILSILDDIKFKNSNDIDVYQDVTFIKSSGSFTVKEAFVEFSEDEGVGDNIIYICEDGNIRITDFKDYSMERVKSFSIFTSSSHPQITAISRAENDSGYIYFIGTDDGTIIEIRNIVSDSKRSITSFGAFSPEDISEEAVSYLGTDSNALLYIGGINGNTSIINMITGKIQYLSTHFNFGDRIVLAKTVDQNTVLFVSKNEMCTYNLNSSKWNYIGDDVYQFVDFNNPFTEVDGNIDYIIDTMGFEEVPTIQKGKWVYALGLRNDNGEYSPVYKKLNSETGEVKNITLPVEESMVYKGKLCLDGDLIYSIGGDSILHMSESESEDSYKTWISAYDTVNDKWITLTSNFIYLNNGDARFKFTSFYPTVYKDKIYVIKPAIRSISRNENDSFTSSQYRLNKIIKINIPTFESEVYDIENLPQTLIDLDCNVVPLSKDQNSIWFAMGVRDSLGDIFNGYNITQIDFDGETGNITSYSTQDDVCSNELKAYVGNHPETVTKDAFENFSLFYEYNEALVFCNAKFVFYLSRTYKVTQIHALHHSMVEGEYTYSPLISSGEFNAIQRYNFKPENTIMIHSGNNIAFIGGKSSRVPFYLSLDTMSLIPSPRYFERILGNKNSSVLREKDRPLKIVPRCTNKFTELSTCRLGKCIYILASNAYTNSRVLLKKELDRSSSKITLVKNLTEVLKNYYKFTILSVGSNIYIAPYITFAEGTTLPNSLDNLVYFKYNTLDSTINKTTISSETFNVSNETILMYTRRNSLFFTNSENTIEIDNDYGSYTVSSSNIGEIDTTADYIISGITLRNNNVFSIPNAGKISIVCLKGDNSLIVSHDIITSKAYNNSQIVYCGKYVYVSIGSSDNNYSDNELYKFKAENLIYENNGIKSASHILLDSGTSLFNSPFTVSRKNIITIFGKPYVNDNNESLITLTNKTASFSDNQFVPFSTEITISNNENRSESNKFSSYAEPIELFGKEYIAFFGGKESKRSKTTTKIDIYDAEKNVWLKHTPYLPYTLSTFSLGDNSIFGATREKHDTGTEESYPFMLKFEAGVNDNGDVNNISLTQEGYNIFSDYSYPQRAYYAKSGSHLYVIPLTVSGSVSISEHIAHINTNTQELIDTEIPQMNGGNLYYTDNQKLVGAFLNGADNLYLILHNTTTNEISTVVYNASLREWGSVTNGSIISKAKGIKSYSNRSSIHLTVYDSTFTNSKNPNNMPIKAVATYVSNDDTDNNVYSIFYSIDNGIVHVSEETVVASFSSGKPTDITDALTTKLGYIYLVDENNDKVYCIFPDNTSKGFNVKQIPYSSSEIFVSRTSSYNTVYSLSRDFKLEEVSIVDGAFYKNDLDLTSITSDSGVTVISGEMFKAEDDKLTIFFTLSNGNKYIALVNLIDYTKEVIDISETFKTIKNVTLSGNDFLITETSNERDTYSVYKVSYSDIVSGEINPEEIELFNSLRIANNKLFVVNSHDGFFIEENKKIKIISDDGYSGESYINQSTVFEKVINDCLYGVNNGKVIKVPYRHIEKTEIAYSTESITSLKDLVIRSNDILDMRNGLKYINPSIVGGSLERFSKNSVIVGDKIISFFSEDESHENPVIYIENYTTREEEAVVEINLNDSEFDEVPSLNGRKFGYKSEDGITHLYILSYHKLIDISCDTGEISSIENEFITENSYVIQNDSKKNEFIINHDNGYLLFDTYAKEITDVECKYNNANYTSKFILTFTKTFEFYNSLMTKEDSDTYFIGKFNWANNDLIEVTKTNIPKDFASGKVYMNKIGSYFYLVSNDNRSAIKFDSEGNLLEVIDDYTEDSFISTIDAYICLNNEYVNAIEICPNEDQSVIWSKKDNDLSITYSNIDGIFYLDVNSNALDHKVRIETTEVISDKCEIVNTPKYKNDNDVYFAHIVDVSDNKLIDYYFIKDENGNVSIGKNIGEDDINLEPSDPYILIKTQNNSLNIVTNDGIRRVTFSSSYFAMFNVNPKTELDLSNISSNSILVSVSDMKYIICDDKTYVFIFGENGTLKNITSNSTVFTINGSFLPNKEVLSSKNYIGDSTRVCGSKEDKNYEIYFDCIRELSEYYNEYISVSDSGSVINISSPLSEYDISGVEVSYNGLIGAQRSFFSNVLTSIQFTREYEGDNKIAIIDAVQKLDMSSFKILYSANNDNESGKIIAFTNDILNDTLIRNDSYFYNGLYAVAIINSRFINIKSDGVLYSFSYSDNTLPFNTKEDILPVVIVYGERTDISGNSEPRYYTFVNAKGDAATFDKETKSFVDISGYVNVNIPYFSTQAYVFQSNAKISDNSSDNEY